VRIHDEPLPTEGRARLLEVAAHHDHDLLADSIDQPAQPGRVLQAGPGVVDRTRPHDQQQPGVLVQDDVSDLPARLGDELLLGFRPRDLVQHQRRCGQRDVRGDVEVGYLSHVALRDGYAHLPISRPSPSVGSRILFSAYRCGCRGHSAPDKELARRCPESTSS
jgi:hypothetical protein